MNQIKLTQGGKLLNDKGELSETGYSTELVKEYNRDDIKARGIRIKEWDYYFIGSDSNVGLSLTFGDIGYIGSASVTLFNFDSNNPSFKTKSNLLLFPFGKYKFPSTVYQDQLLEYSITDFKLSFKHNQEQSTRNLYCNSKNYDGNGNDLLVDITLSDFPKDAMVIATNFKESPNAFYYNCKVNNMSAQGTVKLNGNIIHTFTKETSQCVLDWGRGVWPYKEITWYWSSLSCILDGGDKFGFNIGYGFGNNSNATENMLFYNGIFHKLDQVEFIIPTVPQSSNEDFVSNWKFTSNDKRLEMEFKPILNRTDVTNLLLIKSNTNQVFGLFSGTAILDDGTQITFTDKLGFAEKVINKW